MGDLYFLTRTNRDLSNDKCSEGTALIKANSISEIRDYCREDEKKFDTTKFEVGYQWKALEEDVHYIDIRGNKEN
ncbi:MAG: hypothetical protein ACRDD7_11190 [Peptostreptococcaceae bacterium]